MLDRYELADIAGRIAATENRLQRLRHHVARLEQEGSDARPAREIAEFLSNNLGGSIPGNPACGVPAGR